MLFAYHNRLDQAYRDLFLATFCHQFILKAGKRVKQLIWDVKHKPDMTQQEKINAVVEAQRLENSCKQYAATLETLEKQYAD